MKVFYDIEQGSDEWKKIRKGKPTASEFSNIITAAKGELSKSAGPYINKLIGECFCPDWEEWEGNRYMDRGKIFEPEALDAFGAETGFKLSYPGFCLADDGVCGCSPDALVVNDTDPTRYAGGVEIKCPIPSTHVGYVRAGVLPDDYKQQVHGSMAVTGLNEWHFWSYFPGMRHLHVVVKRDDYTKKLEESLAKFVEQFKAAYAEAFPKLHIPSI